MANVCHKGGL